MGFFRHLSNFLGLGRRNVDIIVVGLDNSGKTTILNQLKPPESRLTTIVPTMGYTVTNFTSENFNFNAFDMAGQSKYRSVWETYYGAAQAVIFVVDSSDKLRMAVARDELWMIFDHKDVSNRQLPILIFANKSDLPDSVSAAEMTQILGLDVVRGHQWHIISCCALSNSNSNGLEDGMRWIGERLKERLESAAK